MGFWIFMLISDMLIPVTMIGFGKLFMKKAPDKINGGFGYRTPMSMKNMDTWVFAHKYHGKRWYVCGLVTLPITIVLFCLVIGKDVDFVGLAGGVICAAQMIPLIGAIVSTEIALRKHFDHNGNRKFVSSNQ